MTEEWRLFKAFLWEALGVNEVLSKLKEIQEGHMATFQEILEAIQTNGTLIAENTDTLLNESVEIQKAIEDAKNGVATPEQLSSALETIKANNEKLVQLKDTAAQLIPTVVSPEEPTPVPTPENPPVDSLPEPQPLPTEPEEIEIVPAPEVGFPGSVAIDIV